MTHSYFYELPLILQKLKSTCFMVSKTERKEHVNMIMFLQHCGNKSNFPFQLDTLAAEYVSVFMLTPEVVLYVRNVIKSREDGKKGP